MGTLFSFSKENGSKPILGDLLDNRSGEDGQACQLLSIIHSQNITHPSQSCFKTSQREGEVERAVRGIQSTIISS